jgi:hypothetical protein
VPRSITAKNLGVVFAEKAEAIANQAKRLPCKWLDFLIPNLTITFRPPAQPLLNRAYPARATIPGLSSTRQRQWLTQRPLYASSSEG